jgi:hypothetical protein
MPAGKGLRVGVYFNGLGAGGIYEALSRAPGVAPIWIYQLHRTLLDRVQVLVLPQFFDLSDMTQEVARTLRGWVEGGGRLMLTREAVGMRWHPSLFPEVAQGARFAPGRTVQLAATLPGFSRGLRIEHEYKDHAQLELASLAKVLVKDHKSGKPVVVAGRVGKGLVILNGLVPGYEEESDPTSNSARLMVALVQHQ